MTSISLETLAGVIAEELGNAVKATDFDLTVVDLPACLEVATDDWTLHIDGQDAGLVGWLAVDNDPDNDAEFAVAISAAMKSAEIAAIVRANTASDNEIRRALLASEDPLSSWFAHKYLE